MYYLVAANDNSKTILMTFNISDEKCGMRAKVFYTFI